MAPQRVSFAASFLHPTFPLVLALAAAAPAAAAQSLDAAVSAPGRVVVELKATVGDLPEQLDVATAFANDSAMRSALASYGATSIYRVFRSGGVAPRDPALFHALGMHLHYVVELGEQADLAAAQRAFASAASVSSVRLDGVVHTTGTPNDPLFPNQWDHRQSSDSDMDTDLAWDVGTSNASVIVAINDTGCDFAHPDLAGAMIPGWNFVSNNNNAQDNHGHGTACAGIAGARANNGLAISGVAPNCTIMPVKVLNSSGNGTYTNVAAGITFAGNNGAKVISMSLTGPCCDNGVEVAMQYVAGLDVLVVSATGNSNVLGVGYPASNSFGMAIGASSPCDERKNPASCDGENFWGSNYGPETDVIAPGVQIPTTTLGGGTTLGFNGTSAATPHVAGIAALVRALDPSLSYTAVRSLLQNTAEDQVGPPSEDTPGFDIYFGFGRVNAHRAALAAIGANTFCFADGSGTPPPCGNSGGPDVGARNTTNTGALLNASGSSSVSLDNLVLTASRLPLNKVGLVLIGAGVNNGGNGSTFYDGLLCVSAGGIGVFRLPSQNSGPLGTVVQGPGNVLYSCTHFGGVACFQPGAHWNFQCWYRDQGGPCATSANLTNAIGVTFRP